MQDPALKERFATLARMPAELAGRARLFSAEEAGRRTAAGGFSLIEQAWHLADLERQAFAVRIDRLRREESPALPDFDGAAAAIAGRYHERELAPALAAFAAARAQNLAVLGGLLPKEWSRRGTQVGVGALTLADIPRLMAEHDAAHRQELDALEAGQFARVLAETPPRLRSALAEFDAAALRRAPASPPPDAEALSPLGHACHLRDIEIEGYHARIARTRTESNPHLPSIDSDRLALERGYDAADPAEALRAFEDARAGTLATLRGVAPEEWSRPADFEGYGAVTLLGLIGILSSHDRVHLAALGAMPRR